MTTPAWVPPGATIHIDFVGAQAWVSGTGVVDIATLLGHDANTDFGWGTTSYHPEFLTADGYRYGDDAHAYYTGFIGATRSAILAGTTMRYSVKQVGTDPRHIDFVIMSADGNEGVQFNAYVYPTLTYVGTSSWSGPLDETVDNVTNPGMGHINTLAFTTTPTRFEWACNGQTAYAYVLDSTDYPTTGSSPMAAALIDTYNTSTALQSITFFPTLPSSAGLSALSVDGSTGISGGTTAGAGAMDGAGQMIGISVSGAAIGQMDGVASMVARTFINVSMVEHLISGDAASLGRSTQAALLQRFNFLPGTLKAVQIRKAATQDAFNLTDVTPSYRMKFLKVLKETAITLTHGSEPHLHYHWAFTAPISVRQTLAPTWAAVFNLVQNLGIHPTTSQKFIWGRTLKEVLKISAVMNAGGRYKASLAQLFKLNELEGLKLSHPVTLVQNINLSLSIAGMSSLKLLQKLLVAATPSSKFTYHFALTARVTIEDFLDRLTMAALMQLFTVHPTINRQFTANSSLAQLLTIHPAFTNKLVLQITGNIQLSPAQLVSMIYRGDPLLDKVVITALYISPSGVTTTWAVNTRTSAVTEYLNYDFRSFASMGNRYIAAGDEGLYELDGDTDDGELIISRLMSGYLQLNEKKLFGLKGAYVAIRGGGRFYLKLIAGDGREYIYELKAQPNLMTTKVRVGKGIKTTYMAFELVTEGQDFDLDSIEFIPMTSGRRV